MLGDRLETTCNLVVLSPLLATTFAKEALVERVEADKKHEEEDDCEDDCERRIDNF